MRYKKAAFGFAGVLSLVFLVLSNKNSEDETCEDVKEKALELSDSEKEVLGPGDIREETGIEMKIPAIVSGEEYSIPDEGIGQAIFVIDGVKYRYRVKQTDLEDNISGYSHFGHVRAMTLDQGAYAMYYDDNGPAASAWYDAKTGIAHCIVADKIEDLNSLAVVTNYFFNVQ